MFGRDEQNSRGHVGRNFLITIYEKRIETVRSNDSIHNAFNKIWSLDLAIADRHLDILRVDLTPSVVRRVQWL